MLNLDTIKTNTIYSKAEIHSLYFQFRQILNEAYSIQSQIQTSVLEQQTKNTLEYIPDMLQFVYHLRDVSHFLKEFNEMGQMQALSLFEVLFLKSNSWKAYKEIVQKWVAILMHQITKFFPNYKIKPQIAQKYESVSGKNIDVDFLAAFMKKIAKSNNIELMMACVSFLRVFIINQLQNKKRDFQILDKNKSLQNQTWTLINESLIRIKINLNNLKKEEICISISYWLCNTRSQFIKQCIKKGMINILSQSLKNKEISEWYGKKIINFLKLLLIALKQSEENSTNFSVNDLESCIAKFTMKYDSESVMKQARALFKLLQNSDGKLEKQQEAYQNLCAYRKNNKDKPEKDKQKISNQAITNTRIVVLYGEEAKLIKELEQTQNQQYLLNCASKKDQELPLLNEVWNILAYNTKSYEKGSKTSYPPKIIIENLANILSSQKNKPELNAGKKKLLISYLRMVKQLLSSNTERNKVIELLNKFGVVKKFYKFSDCTNFRYERQLYSLQSLLTANSAEKQEISEDANQVMKALTKHLQENSQNKFSKRTVEEDLEQVRLFYEMICANETKRSHEIDGETVRAVSKKITTNNNEQSIQISILDNSEAERHQELIEEINYYAIASLKELEVQSRSIQAQDHNKYQIQEEEIKKIIAIGKDPETKKETLKVIVQYLQKLLEHDGVSEKYERDVKEIVSNYYSGIDDSPVLTALSQPPLSTNSNSKQIAHSQTKVRDEEQGPFTIETILLDMTKKQLSSKQFSHLFSKENFNEQLPTFLVMVEQKKLYHNFGEANSLESDQASTNKMSNLIMVLLVLTQYAAKNRIMKLLVDKGINKEQFLGSLQLLLKESFEDSNEQVCGYQECLSKLIYRLFTNLIKEWAYLQEIKGVEDIEKESLLEKWELQQVSGPFWVSSFQSLLDRSYLDYSRQSITYTDASLQYFDYSLVSQQQIHKCSLQERSQKILSLIYTSPQLITREVSQILANSQTSISPSKFWSLYQERVMNELEGGNSFVINFIQRYCRRISNDTWKQYRIQNLILPIVNQISQNNSSLLKKLKPEEKNDERETGARRYLSTLKTIRAMISNEMIQPPLPLINSIYSVISEFLLACPALQKSRSSAFEYHYIGVSVEILKGILKNKEFFYEQVVGKQENIFEEGISKLFEKIIEHGSLWMNEFCLQMIRIMLLRDEGRHIKFIKNLYFNNKQKLLRIKDQQTSLTQKAQEHFQAIELIISYYQKKQQKLIKQQYFRYFFNQDYQITQADQLPTELSFTDEEFLKHLKNLLNPPFQYGIIELSKHFRTIKTKEAAAVYIKVFNITEKLFMLEVQKIDEPTDHRKSLKTIPSSVTNIEEQITQHIWGAGIEIGPDFHEMINKNLRGLKVCLKVKSIGEEGVKIVCEKTYQYPEELALCAYILHLNCQSKKEWEVVYSKHLPTLINKKYVNPSESSCSLPQFIQKVSYFIGSSGYFQKIQEQFSIQENVFANLSLYREDYETLISILYAIAGLVYLNEKNQKIFGKIDKIKLYAQVLNDLIRCMPQDKYLLIIFENMCRLLSNLVYRNLHLVSVYLGSDIHLILFKMFLALPSYKYESYKQFLRLIGNMSLTLEGANSIAAKTPFLQLLQTIGNDVIEHNNPNLIKYLLQIIFYLLNYHEVEVKSIAYKIYELKCTPTILKFLSMYSEDPEIVSSGLDALDRILAVQANRQQAIEETKFLQWLEQLVNIHVWNWDIFRKWLKVLFQVSKGEDCLNHIINTQLLLKLSSFVKHHSDNENCDHTIISLLIEISDVYCDQCSNKKKFVSSGLVDLLCELLKFRILKSGQASKILDHFIELNNARILNPPSYTKIFEALIIRLEIEYKEENSLKIISILIKIRDKILITTNSAAILLEFSYMYLTQKEILLSAKYHRRVREFVTLLAYFIAFNFELKIIFAHEQQRGFIEILESWIKIDKSLEEDNSIAEACRVCMFVIYNEQRYLVDVSEQMRMNQEILINKLNTNTKCMLYRRNHTNKNAIVRLKEEKDKDKKDKNRVRQIVAFKAPDGEIKEKYTLPLTDVISVRADFNEEDRCFKGSVFAMPGSFFQKSANPKLCASIVGIVGEQLSIRQLDLEFLSQKDKNRFIEDFRYAVSIQYKQNRSDF